MTEQLHVPIRLRWWVPRLLSAVALVAWLTGRSPNTERLGRFVARFGTRVVQCPCKGRAAP